MQNSKILRVYQKAFFFCIFCLLIIMVNGCKYQHNSKLAISLINQTDKVVLDSIYSSSEKNGCEVLNLFNADTLDYWSPIDGFTDGEFIFLRFSRPVYLYQLIINQCLSEFDNPIRQFRIITDTKIIETNNLDNLYIKSNARFVIIQIMETNKASGVDAIINQLHYKIFKADTLQKIKISAIKFLDKNRQEINVVYGSSSNHLKKANNTYAGNHSKLNYGIKQIVNNMNGKKTNLVLSLYPNKFFAYNEINKNAGNLITHRVYYSGTWDFENTGFGFQKIKLEGTLLKYRVKKGSSIISNSIVNENCTTELNFNSYQITTSKVIGTIFYDIPDDALVQVSQFDSSILIDIKYATSNNFTGKQLYDCPVCYLHYDVAKDILALSDSLKTLGFRLKLFDCYRPLSIQEKMWEAFPNKNFVANPEKGSIHNRGGAVDVTLADVFGVELDMGTAYDYFGKEAFHDFQALPARVIENRNFLRSMMEKFNFKAIKTEWWHYSNIKCLKYPIDNTPLPCEN